MSSNLLPCLTDIASQLSTTLSSGLWASIPVVTTMEPGRENTNCIVLTVSSETPQESVPETNNTIRAEINIAAQVGLRNSSDGIAISSTTDPGTATDLGSNIDEAAQQLADAVKTVMAAYPGTVSTGTSYGCLPVYYHIGAFTAAPSPIDPSAYIIAANMTLVLQF